MKRRELRAIALQAIYQVDVGKTDGAAALAHVLADVEAPVSAREEQFIRRLVDGTCALATELDELISRRVEGWRLDRMARVDLAILRLAAFELAAETETDVATIVNEAVELAKQFSTEESGRFINGALSRLLPELIERRKLQSE
ncbi:MAG: transcription antitermination factor NusB [Alicyclobacillus sp.]|nr:transcription antitermination factor NusB [Alicyclobacillus sp.]